MAANQTQRMAEFIARQLNDHKSSPRGAEQPTFYTWTEAHILDAIEMGVDYLWSIKPDEFGERQCFKMKENSCTIDLKKKCNKVLKIISVGSSCNDLEERNSKHRDMMGLLGTACFDPEHDADDVSSYQELTQGIFKLDKIVPEGTTINYICAKKPDINSVSSSLLSEYRNLIVPFALWYLLLTDNESRSNPLRWEAYYIQVKDFVTLKLRIEFSLRAEDYIDGERNYSNTDVRG